MKALLFIIVAAPLSFSKIVSIPSPRLGYFPLLYLILHLEMWAENEYHIFGIQYILWMPFALYDHRDMVETYHHFLNLEHRNLLDRNKHNSPHASKSIHCFYRWDRYIFFGSFANPPKRYTISIECPFLNIVIRFHQIFLLVRMFS